MKKLQVNPGRITRLIQEGLYGSSRKGLQVIPGRNCRLNQKGLQG
jgi:hypothetical protein